MVVIQLLIAAALFAASFQPIGLWFLAPISYAIFFHLIRGQQNTYLISFSFAFISNLAILYWSGAFVGLLPWLLLGILQGLYYLPIGFIAYRTRSIPAIIFSILLIDEIKSRFPFGGFGWTRIAFSQIDSPFVNSIALGGAITLSALTLMISWGLVAPRRSILFTLVALLPLIALSDSAQISDETLNVRAIQGGVSKPGLGFNDRAFEVLKNHIRESERTQSKNDQLVIWPENSIDIDPLRNDLSRKLINDYIQLSNLPLIAGAVIERDGLKNVAIAYDSVGNVQSIYEKRYLTPFGEFIPLRSIAQIVSPYADDVTDFSPGSEAVIHEVAGHKIASIICYEIINDGIVREAAKRSELLVVHTNSATFFGTAEGEQQLAITRLRAIEHARAIVSVSTTGPSAMIDARGVVLREINEGERGAISAAMQLTSSQTLADKLGGLAQLLVLTIFILLAMINRREVR